MTLLETIQTIEHVAAAQPAVRSIVRQDVYRLNGARDVRYGVFAWVQGEHAYTPDSWCNRYRFSFFYIDRLRADTANEAEVQSVGIDTLRNILQTLPEEWEVSEASFTPFAYRFADDCAGVWASVTLDVPADTPCGVTYETNEIQIIQ